MLWKLYLRCHRQDPSGHWRLAKPPVGWDLSNYVHRCRSLFSQGRQSHQEACSLCNSGNHSGWQKGCNQPANRRKRKQQVLAWSSKRTEKPWSKGCYDNLCGRINRNERIHRNGLSWYGISKVYRSSSQKYPEICAIQGYESLCGRFKDNLPCTEWRAGTGAIRACDREMGSKIS